MSVRSVAAMSTCARALPCAKLVHDFGHVPGTDCARGKPEISIAMPVLVILGAADFRTHEGRAYSTILVQLNPVLHIAPGPVNDLRPTFGLQFAASGRICVDK